MNQDDPDTVHIASEISTWYLQYPEYFDICREMWTEFIRNPQADKEVYVETMYKTVAELNDSTVPEDDRADLATAAFWAASADAIFNSEAQNAMTSADSIHESMAGVW